MRCAPRVSNGPDHLGLCAFQMFQAWKLARKHKVPQALQDQLKSYNDRIKSGEPYDRTGQGGGGGGGGGGSGGGGEKPAATKAATNGQRQTKSPTKKKASPGAAAAKDEQAEKRALIMARVKAAKEKQERGENPELTDEEKNRITAGFLASASAGAASSFSFTFRVQRSFRISAFL